MITIGNRMIGPGQPCFIIAEAGVNHNGSLETAKRLVDIAKEAGVDAVKFQTWKTENLMLRDTPKAQYQLEQTGEGTQFEMVKQLELSYSQFKELKEYCDQQGILFLSTPDEEESAAFLYDLGVPLFKIGSGELTNLLYLRRVARYGRPMIVSTGMATMREVEAAYRAITSEGNNDVIFLHCTTDYPARLEDVNLRSMLTMREILGILVGYSDHTEGIDVPLAAVYAGAVVIEKHFTYDRAAPGPDHKASLGPQDLAEMVRKIRAYEVMLGSAEKGPTERERANMVVVRKSVVLAQDVLQGTAITEEMLVMIRAGDRGIPAPEYEPVLGRTATHDLKKGSLLLPSDLA